MGLKKGTSQGHTLVLQSKVLLPWWNNPKENFEQQNYNCVQRYLGKWPYWCCTWIYKELNVVKPERNSSRRCHWREWRPSILRHWKFDLISFRSKNHHIFFSFVYQLLTDITNDCPWPNLGKNCQCSWWTQ